MNHQKNVARARARLEAIPHLDCGHYPTPIEEMKRLREALGGGPRLLIKRDDYTGPGFGGNKVRKLEYVLAAAHADGVDTVITAGGEMSNHARITAALAARLGLRTILVLNTAADAPTGRLVRPASLRLDELYGAEIHRVGEREERAPMMREIADKLRAEGRRVFEIPIGASIPLGALGYVRAAGEAAEQLAANDMHPTYIFHSSSSGGTQAGLAVGCQLFNLEAKIIGVSPDDPAPVIAESVRSIMQGLGELLALPGSADVDLTVLDDYIGPGYGALSDQSFEATKLVARTEGIVLDPVYTAKAMAALIDWIEKGRIGADETVLFWHTGGQLAMFYSAEG
jgi:D-cysteine desulfhydrase family pyridoxal phosphate-dependent enzyme